MVNAEPRTLNDTPSTALRAGLSIVEGRVRVRVASVCVSAFFALVSVAEAQNVQVSGFGGYRFGGDLFEAITARPLDIDGAPSFGATLDVFLYGGQSVTFTWSHQQARADVPAPNGDIASATASNSRARRRFTRSAPRRGRQPVR